ncbi:hypothetical protein GA0070622_1267 [Micromonospora sediminicola]|uniref:Uncharacterized protein n=1 Tax=Micromonospora sediminicola TaxID=946078 RepID=A0A1A9B5I6_9ACTN|nr:hypothetical protein [Micromonospora sediminicola]SBT64294.1 hypothetical protein GA0070622_1267 [Micromonospora sediminicola]
MSDESSKGAPVSDEPSEDAEESGDKLSSSGQEKQGVKFSPERFQDNYRRVADIGEGRRWYDLPYRVVSWLLSSRMRRVVRPQKLRERLAYLSTYLAVFNDHERNKKWDLDDPLHNVRVPPQEHVHMPGIWVVELFPPSQFSSLDQAIRKGDWDRHRRWIYDGRDNRRYLELSRSGKGWSWWRLADIAQKGSKIWLADSTREDLPEAFETVQLKAVQIGAGLTAVVAFFRLTDTAARRLDRVWHEKHEPRLAFGKGLPRAEDRQWASFRLTQKARRALHDAARRWMAERCPGYFSSYSEPQPLLDLLLMNEFDPTKGERVDRELADALRAIGFTGDLLHTTSSDLPGILLSPVDGELCRALEGKRTWGLWGNRKVLAAIPGYLEGRGNDVDHAIAHVADDRIRSFSVILAISGFLEIAESEYAKLRDSARARHHTFKASRLNYLRRSLLTLSLDLTSVARDVQEFWKRNWREAHDIEFIVDQAPWISQEDQALGRERFEATSMTSELRERQHKWFDKLITADRDYRDILSTVAALGASADTYKISRVALWAAIASLAIAAVTLLFAEVKDQNVLSALLSWLKRVLEAQ